MKETAGRYSRIKSRFWRDEKSMLWPNDAKYLALYILTCPHGNILGLYVLPKLYICADLEWSPETLEAAMARLIADGFIEYDEANRTVLIVNWLDHNPLENPNQVTAAIKMLRELPRTPLLEQLGESLQAAGQPFVSPLLAEIDERLPKPLPQPLEEPLPKEYGEPVSVSVTVTGSVDKDLCASSDAQETVEASHETGVSHDPAPSVEAQKVTAKAGKERPRFDLFWSAYPKKRSKGDAQKAWAKLNPGLELFERIMSGLESARASPDWLKDNGQFIPYPASWLRAKGWEDEYEEVNADGKRGADQKAARETREFDDLVIR